MSRSIKTLSERGVDLVVEVGGVGTLNESIRATKIGGTIAFIGVLAGSPPAQSRISLMVMQQQRLQGVTVGSVEDLQAMVDAIAPELGLLPAVLHWELRHSGRCSAIVAMRYV
jgi:D-arabinose 1-dehydrogenase-like Zn-dependent alcohol dehydrogenase